MHEVWIYLQTKVDHSLSPAWTTWNKLNKKNPKAVEFLKNHTRNDRYHIEYFRCSTEGCCCGKVRMPMHVWETLHGCPRFLPFPMPVSDDDKEEYLSFDVVKDMETNGSHWPSAKINNMKGNSIKKSTTSWVVGNEGRKKNLFTQKNVRHKITCIECRKVRLVFAFPFDGADWWKLRAELDCMTEESGYEYACGNTLFGCNIGDDFPHPPCLDVFCVWSGIECGTEIESYYYSLSEPALCCQCGVDSGLVTSNMLDELLDSNAETRGKRGRPMCTTCQEQC